MTEDQHFEELLAQRAKTLATVQQLLERIRLLAFEYAAFLEYAQRLEWQWQMNSILDTITDGIVALDRDWRFIYVNQRGAEIIGQSPKLYWVSVYGSFTQKRLRRPSTESIIEPLMTSVQSISKSFTPP